MSRRPQPSAAGFGWAVPAVFAFFLALITLVNTALLEIPRRRYAGRAVPTPSASG